MGKRNESCKNYGIKLPEYTVYPEDIMVKFEALGSDMNTDIVFNEQHLLECLKQKPNITQKELAEYFHVTKRTIERNIMILKKEKYIERVGNNRSGHWKIIK